LLVVDVLGFSSTNYILNEHVLAREVMPSDVLRLIVYAPVHSVAYIMAMRPMASLCFFHH